MDTSKKKTNSPEEDELELKRIELAKLSELLAEKELELTTLRSFVLHFEHRYLKEVGIKYVELDEINAQIAEKMARENPQDTAFQEESEIDRETANSTAKEFRSHEVPNEEEARIFANASEEVKREHLHFVVLTFLNWATGEKEK